MFEKALKIFGPDSIIPVPRNQKYTNDEEKSILVGSAQIINYINEIAPDVEIYETTPESTPESTVDNNLDDIRITK